MSFKSLSSFFITAAVLFAATSAVPTPKNLPVNVTPDCSVVSCPLRICQIGESLVVPEGQCCPECVLDCSIISCLLPVCEKGEILVVPPGQCCPKCVSDKAPDCSAVFCIAQACEEGEKAIVPPGQCCPKCVPDKIPDCSAVFCLAQACEKGERAIIPPGQCCPKCVPDRPRSRRNLENDCPPTCSVEFCSKNPRAQCSNPGPREIPGCTGSCQLTYCHACYSGEEFIPRPEGCPTCGDLRDYLFDSACFRQWADCVSRKVIHLDAGKGDLKCFNPPCPFKG